MESLPSLLWEQRWRLAAWLVPALVITAFAHYAVLPLAARLGESRAQLASMRENRYEPAWLDSTQAGLRGEVDALRAFHASRQAALNRDASVQATLDRIRALAQKSGFEVVKTTPALGKLDSLRVMKIRIDGFTGYPGLMALFDTLRTAHPDLYVEEMLVRRGGERARGRLEGHLLIHAYGQRAGGSP